MRMTHAEFLAYSARRSASWKRDQERQGNGDTVEKESDLHDQIFSECRRRGWIALHGSMAERTARNLGEPDYVIVGSVTETWTDGTGPSKSPRIWLIECKSKTGKLSPAQAAMAHHAAHLGHTIHVVRSFAEFLEVVKV